MPTFSLLIEDTSPILTYSQSDWTAGTSENDSEADQYTESSFTKTQLSGANVHITFNGTGATIVGAKRDNHGLFSVSLDGVETSPINGSVTPNIFNQTLFESSLLEHGSHSLLLTNLDPAFVDIDYVALQTSIGDDTEDLIVNTFQNVHPIFSYSPLSSWKTPNYASSFSGGVGHATQDVGSVVDISFQGDGIAVYGAVGPNMTRAYNVQIDNGTSVSFSAQQTFYRAQQIIFLATNLGPGSHLLSMELGAGGEGEELSIDYANVFTTKSLGGSFLEKNSTSPLLSQPSPTLPRGIIVALALSSVISLAGICGFVYLILTHSRRRLRNIKRQVVQPFDITVNHPNVGPPNLPYSPSLQHRSPNFFNHSVGSFENRSQTHRSRTTTSPTAFQSSRSPISLLYPPPPRYKESI